VWGEEVSTFCSAIKEVIEEEKEKKEEEEVTLFHLQKLKFLLGKVRPGGKVP